MNDDKAQSMLAKLVMSIMVASGYGIAKQHAVAKLDDKGNPYIDWAAADVAAKESAAKLLKETDESPAPSLHGLTGKGWS